MATGIINEAYLNSEHAAKLNQLYINAKPCKYLVMENFFTEEIADDLFENFPSIKDLNVKRKSLNEDKSEDYHFERWHPSFAKIREAVSSNQWYQQLEKITGIEGLHTTDALGSGVHQGKNGSYVDIHIDVNMNPKLGLWRRINLLVYLNKNWKAEYGGDLELWNKEMTECMVKVRPRSILRSFFIRMTTVRTAIEKSIFRRTKAEKASIHTSIPNQKRSFLQRFKICIKTR